MLVYAMQSSEEADQSIDSPPSEEQEEKKDGQEDTVKADYVDAITEESSLQTEEPAEKPAEDVDAEAADQGDTEEESPGPLRLTVDDLKTAPMDFRFPTCNQAKHCFTRYIEYHRCVREKGEEVPECEKFARYYRSLCPGEWIERWNEQRENGTFPGPL
eukprot:c15805_g1_i2 orf=154-630(+)